MKPQTLASALFTLTAWFTRLPWPWLRALADAVDTFHPDQIVIATLPPGDSVWQRFDVVDRARTEYPNVPVTHVVATPVSVEDSPR